MIQTIVNTVKCWGRLCILLLAASFASPPVVSAFDRDAYCTETPPFVSGVVMMRDAGVSLDDAQIQARDLAQSKFPNDEQMTEQALILYDLITQYIYDYRIRRGRSTQAIQADVWDWCVRAGEHNENDSNEPPTPDTPSEFSTPS